VSPFISSHYTGLCKPASCNTGSVCGKMAIRGQSRIAVTDVCSSWMAEISERNWRNRARARSRWECESAHARA